MVDQGAFAFKFKARLKAVSVCLNSFVSGLHADQPYQERRGFSAAVTL